MNSEKPEYFNLRPEVEKAYGYSHAVKIGNSIKVSGAVSMDDEGSPTAVGDFLQQMKSSMTLLMSNKGMIICHAKIPCGL